ncbi:MAG TPA: peptidase MA family metallohydrolase [Terriglobales bacterium]|nr:peptidase MA family metallohydrolase [Terriglobales bacterium]
MRNALVAFCTSLLLATNILVADTIYFKNGAYIEVDKVSEKDGQIEYWVGSTRYTILNTKVQKIVKGDGPSITLGPQVPVNLVPPSSADAASQHSSSNPLPNAAASRHSKIAVSSPSLPATDSYWSSLRAQVVNRDHVDEGALSELEHREGPDQVSNAYFVAGVFEMERGHPESACEYFVHALRLAPDEGSLLAWYAMSLAEARRYPEAAAQAEHLTKVEPNSAQAFRWLAAAQYNADHTRDAVRAWKRALELEPNPETHRLLERAQNELDVEERSNQQESPHFSLRYEGGETSLELQRDLLGTLEEQYRLLARDLDYSPSANIVVTLYTQKQFFDITQAPSWSSGLNDGKLRIPIRGVARMTPELQQVLKHELTHSFVRFMVGDRCPSWLNEGLAQLMEPRSSSPYAAVLAGLFAQHKQIPFAALEHPFNGLSENQAVVAYAESLSALEYLRGRYGMDGILRILRRVGSGEAPQDVLRAVTGSDYPDLERRLAAYLEDQRSH